MYKKNASHIKKSGKFIWTGIVISIFWWFLESALHSFVFYETSFRQEAFMPAAHEAWMRSLVACLFIAFGIYGQSTINRRKRIEAVLSKSEEKLAGVVASVTDTMIMLDNEFRVVWINDVARDVFGPDIIGRRCYRIYHGRDCICDPCIVKDCFKDGEIHEFETYLTGPDGKRNNLWCTASVASRHEDGRPKMVVESMRDITDRKWSKREIERLNQQIEFVLGATRTGLDIIDSEFNIRYIDPGWGKQYGDYNNRKCYDYFTGRSEPCSNCAVAKVMQTKKSVVSERILQNEDDRAVQVTTIPFQNEEGEWLFAQVNIDISERKKAEKEKHEIQAQLQQAQKMEAVGTLAGGIAHDFNNILQAISGYIQLLSMKSENKEPDSRYLRQIDIAAQRAAELTKQRLIFGRRVQSRLKPVDLNQEVLQVHKLLERTIPKMIEIKLHLATDLKIINADAVQIEQVIMNLAINAKDAMSGIGKLVFETGNITLDRESSKNRMEIIPGEYVQFSVTDTGDGIDKQIIEHIFEPFYTTKEMGRGTGLGLAMVYGIVKNHNGHIICNSKPGDGSTFTIYFPVLEEKTVQEEQRVEKESKKTDGHETILLVDDEQNLRDLGQEMLKQHGYTTVVAASGENAVEIYEREQARIDLVILDIGMPGMGGFKCLEKLLEINPETKVIIASGYASSDKLDRALASGACGFISKPYRHKDMLNEARRILDQGKEL